MSQLPDLPKEQRDWITPAELAQELHIPLSTLYAWRSQRKGPRGHKIGVHIRYSRADIKTWLDSTADDAPE